MSPARRHPGGARRRAELTLELATHTHPCFAFGAPRPGDSRLAHVRDALSVLKSGDIVRVTEDWLGVAKGARGRIVGEVARAHPVTQLVRFRGGVRPIPDVHLEPARARRLLPGR